MKSEVMEFLPKARRAKIVIKQIADEVLVYDLEWHKAHCLRHQRPVLFRSMFGLHLHLDPVGGQGFRNAVPGR